MKIIENSTLVSIADSIRAIDGSSDTIPGSELAEQITLKYDIEKAKRDNLKDLYRVITDKSSLNGTSLYDDLWDTMQQGGERTAYTGLNSDRASTPNSFSGWTSKYIFPKYPLAPKTGYGMFALCKNLVTAPPITFPTSKVGSWGAMFYGCDNLERAENLSFICGSASYNFTNCKKLKKISFTSDETTNYSGTFSMCTSLEEVEVFGTIGKSINFGNSSKLTKESVISIFSALSPSADGMSVSFRPLAKARFSESEWESLLDSKPNWKVIII